MKTKERLCSKIVLCIFSLLVLCRTAGAQDAAKATLTAADAGTCAATSTACLVINVPSGSGGATFNIGANASANTVQFEATADYGTTWVTLSVTPSNSTTTVTSTTSTGAWQANVAGYTKVRMRCSTFVGGTTTTYINLSTASARAGGGGAGGSAFPVTVTGGVSGGIPCFTSTTVEASSSLLVQYGILEGGGAGVCPSTVAPPTSPNGVSYVFSSTPAGGVAVAPVFALPGVAGRTNAGATDAIVAADRGTIITETFNGAVAVSLPQAGTANFANNFYFGIIVSNINGNNTVVTITPAAGQIAIDGTALAATLVLQQGSTTYCYSFDNANYQCTAGSMLPPTCVIQGNFITCNSSNTAVNNLTALSYVKIDNNNFGNTFQQSTNTTAARTTSFPDASINAEGGFCINTTPVTLPGTNTTADQNLMACTITAKALSFAGRTIRIHAKDVYTTVAGNLSTITRKFKLCSVSGCASGNVTTLVTITSSAQVGTITNDPIILDAIATTTTAGAASRFEASGDLIIDLAAATTAAESTFLDTNTGTLAGTPSDLDITAQIFLQSTISFSIGNAGNVATERQMTVEIIN